MITLRGKLIVNNQSRVLDCELGQFAVQDERLTAIQPGEYSGFFEISSIELRNDSRNGSIICYQLAVINEFHLLTTEFQASEKSSEKITQSQVSTPAATSSPPSVEDAFSSNDEEELDTAADEELFGGLWPLDTKVKLDPTNSRELLNKQRARLRELGYEPNHETQSWQLAA